MRDVADLGGAVRKGEKSSIVCFWKILERDDDETERRAIPLLRYYNVFNVEQCDGLRLASIERSDIETIETAEAIIAGMPNRPLISYGGDRAFYRPSTDSITLPPVASFASSAISFSALMCCPFPESRSAGSTPHASGF